MSRISLERITGRMRTALLVIGACWFAALPARAADEIARTGPSSPVRGEITAVDREGVTIKAGLGANQKEQKVPANEIERVQWDGEPSKLNLHRNAEQAGRFTEALQGYQQALAEIKADDDRLRIDVGYLIVRATARQALNDPEQIDAAIATVEQFRKQNPTSFRFYEATRLLGELYLARKDLVLANPVFQQLAQAPWPDYQMAARNAVGRLKLADDKPAEAQLEFDAVIALPAESQAAQAQKLQAMLGKAESLSRQSRPAEAQQSIEQVIDQTDAKDSRTLAEAYVRLGNALQAQNKSREALLAYLHVEAIPMLARETQFHPEALLQLSRLWTAIGRPDRAAESRAALTTKYPNSAAARQLAGAAE